MDRFKIESDQYRTKSVYDLLSLSGKTVVVTGGARGMGLAIARGCAEIGANVAILDILENSVSDIELLQTECKVKAKFYKGDVTDYEALEATFKEIVTDFGSIDSLVNAAGIGGGQPITDFGKDDIRKIIDVNLIGTIYATKFAIQQMVKQGQGGTVVNVASVGAHGGIRGQTNSVYCASKGAVISFTKAIAMEWAESGIRANSISPGFVLTNMTPGYLKGDLARLEWFEKGVPMKRFSDRAELKSLVAFLLSPASSYVTGEDVLIDGGLCCC